MPELATTLYHELRGELACFYDDSGAIGRRYRRMDEAGTPFGITVDGETLAARPVTIRHRDTMQQERVGLDRVEGYIKEKLKGTAGS
jgi:glycyl-tRNA synthetase